ncbi:hypothetical protein BGZ76_011215 [Entomortierella beljakovae]|nr:hypothetical protein BGZ76_011215 [Entomortierella beljakovae]
MILPPLNKVQSQLYATDGNIVQSTQQNIGVDTLLPSPTNSEPDIQQDGLKAHEMDFNHFTEPSSVCFGRVKNPEAMVSKTWWKSTFDGIYLQTDGDVVEDPAITLEEIRIVQNRPEIRVILDRSNVQGEPLVQVLDLCCGQGRHVLQLSELFPNVRLYGHDLSKYLIDLANSRALASLANHRVQFSLGDCRSTPFSDKQLDLVLMMGNSFGYFANDQEDIEVLNEVKRILKPGGVVLLDLLDGPYIRENFKPRGWEWANDEMIVCRERCLSEDKRRLVCREVIINTTKGVIRDQFYQERLYESDELSQIMAGVGFDNIRWDLGEMSQGHLDIGSLTKEMSQRGEDLGMMEQRKFLIARKPL